VLAVLVSNHVEFREGACVVLIHLLRYPNLHAPILRAGALAPVLLLLYGTEKREHELACAVLLLLAQVILLLAYFCELCDLFCDRNLAHEKACWKLGV
jgi:hypothetical protein